MLLDNASAYQGPIQRIDPRVRIVAAGLCSIYPLLLTHVDVLYTAVALGFCLVVAAQLPDFGLLKQLFVVNLFLLMLIALMPWSVPGEALIHLGALSFTREGLHQAWLITLRANAIVLSLTALLGTIEPIVFGAALERLWLPKRLVNLFYLTVRYIAVLEDEYKMLGRAIKVRCFDPKLDRHSLRSFGHLIGMLLVRALDRSERIHAAMRCRGFSGVWRHFHTFRLRMTDVAFAGGVAIAVAALCWVDRT